MIRGEVARASRPWGGFTTKKAVLHAASGGLRGLPMLGYVPHTRAVVHRDKNSRFARTPGRGKVL